MPLCVIFITYILRLWKMWNAFGKFLLFEVQKLEHESSHHLLDIGQETRLSEPQFYCP